jgi:L-asparaginase
MSVRRKSQVTLITYGGTIASSVKPGVGATPSLDIGDVARGIPAVNEIAEIVSIPAKLVASPHMTMDDLLDIAHSVSEAVASGADGVVITQGTDTIEEIAFGLDLLYTGSAPVVVTGAMRNASMAGPDGPANLVAAFQVAASKEARGLGTVVVMNDEIHAARFVRKSHTASTATFRSMLTGPIGWIAEREVRVMLQPTRRHHVSVVKGKTMPPVALLKASLGDDGRLLRQLAGCGFAGAVIEGFGGGHLTQYMAAPEVLDPLVEAMPVVLASRAGAGEVLRNTYGGFIGSETDLVKRGVIFAGALDGPKSRVLLALLLASGADRNKIGEVFADIGPLS